MEENRNTNNQDRIGLDDIAQVVESGLILNFLYYSGLITSQEWSEIMDIKNRDGNFSALRKIFGLLYAQENGVEKRQEQCRQFEGAGALNVLKVLYEMANIEPDLAMPCLEGLTTLKIAVETGGDLEEKDENDLTQLHRIFSKENTLSVNKVEEIVKYLADNNLIKLFNIKGGKDKLSPLQMLLAYAEVNEDIVKTMQINGADFHVLEISGHSIVECVIWNSRNTRLLPILISFGVNLKTMDETGNNLLHIAATAGNLEALQILLEKRGSGLNTLNLTSSTPLHRAVCFATTNILPTAKYLIGKGALVNYEDSSGRTVLQMAEERMNDKLLASEIKDVVHFLKQYFEANSYGKASRCLPSEK